MLINDPKILGTLFLGGIVPSLFWLWFWLREDRKNPEPKGLLALVFLLCMAGVYLVLPIQKIIEGFSLPGTWELAAWASVEELMKFVLVFIIVANTGQADEPTDWPIYLITGALGFAALENILFLLKPLSLGQTAVGLLTGHLRFLGSTLLHAVSSGIIGISLGLSFFSGSGVKKAYLLFGIVFAIALHSMFNFFIMKNGGSDFMKVFAFLWIAAIIVFLVFEKLRRMNLSVNQ